jgi:hypothetical protein
LSALEHRIGLTDVNDEKEIIATGVNVCVGYGDGYVRPRRAGAGTHIKGTVMTISISKNTRIQPLPVPNKALRETSAQAGGQVSSLTSPQASSVSISGKALLMARMFEGHILEPAVVKYAPGLDGMFPPYFLTHGDRRLLSSIYEFANGQGADLGYVDDLASGIAHYRRTDNGQEMLPQRPMTRFDMEGHEVMYTFNEKSAETAQRILSGEGIKSTRIDQGFLRFNLDPAYSPMSTLNFDFLEQIVNKFSAVGSTVADFGARFTHFQQGQKNYIKNVSKEVYDIPGLRRGRDGAEPDHDLRAKKAGSAAGANAPQDLATTLRQIIQKYLQKSGLPTLFETLMRFRR